MQLVAPLILWFGEREWLIQQRVIQADIFWPSKRLLGVQCQLNPLLGFTDRFLYLRGES
ncbi:hypothetical protein LCGC14_0323110 [marine sediment metagenome]|uniref:Uncharacterized protein n=1 Tax=marine sediment metagenome TaxID=412755 RepID=A0A0F9U1A9_9ZZZZ